jgi:hypothetical protein
VNPDAQRLKNLSHDPLPPPTPTEAVLHANQAVQIAIADLARLTPLEYEQQREAIAEQFSLRVSVLDQEVEKLRPKQSGPTATQGAAVVCADPQPWGAPVEGKALANGLEEVFNKYVVLPDHGAVMLALWTIHTHAIDAVQVSPYLGITSPEKGCGKTTLESLLRALVRRPLPASNITQAVVFRVIEKCSPTLLIDEADTFLGENEALRGVLNSGHSRDTAYVLRCDPDTNEVRQFSTWGAKAIAMIGHLPGTLADRAIPIQMRRKREAETVSEFTDDSRETCGSLQRQCFRWATDHLEHLRAAKPVMPPALHNRMADNWRPLLAIAAACDGDWPRKAREAAIALTGNREDTESVGTMLLADVAQLFHERDTDRLRSEDITEALREMDHRPWPEWKGGKPLTLRQLAKLLAPFGVKPTTVRFQDGTSKGYTLEMFEDAFARYLPSLRSVTPSQVRIDAAFELFRSVTPDPLVTDRKSQKPATGAGCYAVTDRTTLITGVEHGS